MSEKLLALADETVSATDGCRGHDRVPLSADDVWAYARRIRELCREVIRC